MTNDHEGATSSPVFLKKCTLASSSVPMKGVFGEKSKSSTPSCRRRGDMLQGTWANSSAWSPYKFAGKCGVHKYGAVQRIGRSNFHDDAQNFGIRHIADQQVFRAALFELK